MDERQSLPLLILSPDRRGRRGGDGCEGGLMDSFAYGRAASIEDALAEGSGPNTVFLAGGTELLNWLRLGIAKPERVIDLTQLNGLSEIMRLPDGGLRIGAVARLNDVALNEDVARGYPALFQAILESASAQLRNLATIGGNPFQRTRCGYFRAEETLPCNKRNPGSGCSALNGINDRHAIFGWSESCVAVQPSDPAAALSALDAVYVTVHRGGGRRIMADDLHTLPGDTPSIENVLRDGELIVAIELGATAPHPAYLKLPERDSYGYPVWSA